MTDRPVGDPLEAAAAGLERIFGPRKNREARRRRASSPGSASGSTPAGAGKHPLGATKPLTGERKAKNRAKAKAARKNRRRS